MNLTIFFFTERAPKPSCTHTHTHTAIFAHMLSSFFPSFFSLSFYSLSLSHLCTLFVLISSKSSLIVSIYLLSWHSITSITTTTIFIPTFTSTSTSTSTSTYILTRWFLNQLQLVTFPYTKSQGRMSRDLCPIGLPKSVRRH